MTLTIYPARLVRTLDPGRPTASALAVEGDRIRAVGTLDELTSYGEHAVDERYADSVLLPGLVEAHAHVMGGALWRHTYVGFHERTDPSGVVWAGCTSVEAVLERLRAADAALEDPDAPLLAWGLDPIRFPGERLDRRHLDRVSERRPILVVHQSFHVSTVSSVVLRADGIDAGTTVEGVVKDAAGDPTGELREPVAMALVRSVPSLLRLEFDADAVRGFGADARNQGVTTTVDLGNGSLMDDDAVRGLREVVDDPDFPTRLSVFLMGGGLSQSAPPEVAAERLLELRGTSSDKLRFGHVKLVLDGSIQGFTARLQAPGYLPDDRTGIWLIPPPTFFSMVETFHRAGLLIHVHCNGDEATELFLDAVEAAQQLHYRPDHRHTVTHSQLTTPAQYRRMARLGMCANVFSNHLWYWGDQHREVVLGPDRADRMNAARTALGAGVPLSLHSDSPVTPLDPLATASYAAERRTSTGVPIGDPERITVPQALHAMTLGAAYMLGMDHEVGSLEAGKYADAVALDRDPWDLAPAELREVEVRGTLLGGRSFTPGGGPG